jgi:flagella basal body P-ring formation protein FlgA
MKAIYLCRVLVALGCALSWTAHAAWTPQSRDAVNRFLAQHPSLEGRDFSVQWMPLRVDLPKCEQALHVKLQGREKAWGRLFLSLSCESGRGWTRPVNIDVQVKGRYLVAAQALRPGQNLTAADWQWAQGDLSKVGDAVIEDPALLQDMELIRAHPMGSPLRLNDFRQMTVIKSGDQVRVTLVGRGFAVSATAQALADAAVGGTVRVRTAEGKILQGTAVSSGSVEVLLE